MKLETTAAPGRSLSAGRLAPTIFLLALPEAALLAARAGALVAYPNAIVQLVRHADEVDTENCPRCLVVMDENNSSTASLAAGDSRPRCAVVVLGCTSSDLAETVPPEEWNPGLLARVFRSALLEHELLCETLRLRGDLKTIARRVSHDLRTPVGCIYTTSDVLKELPPDDAEGLVSLTAVIKQSAEEISHTIDRVGFLLKASADPSSPDQVQMGPVVAAALRQLQPVIQSAGAAVESPPNWPKVTGVAAWIQAIWVNLIGNALKHGGAKPRIELAWHEIDEGLQFSVTDHGPGVAPARLAGLFSPFDQLHSLHVPGLGLSIVQRLVTLQGGRCAYENAPGQGARFHFTLPAAR